MLIPSLRKYVSLIATEFTGWRFYSILEFSAFMFMNCSQLCYAKPKIANRRQIICCWSVRTLPKRQNSCEDDFEDYVLRLLRQRNTKLVHLLLWPFLSIDTKLKAFLLKCSVSIFHYFSAQFWVDRNAQKQQRFRLLAIFFGFRWTIHSVIWTLMLGANGCN